MQTGMAYPMTIKKPWVYYLVAASVIEWPLPSRHFPLPSNELSYSDAWAMKREKNKLQIYYTLRANK